MFAIVGIVVSSSTHRDRTLSAMRSMLLRLAWFATLSGASAFLASSPNARCSVVAASPAISKRATPVLFQSRPAGPAPVILFHDHYETARNRTKFRLDVGGTLFITTRETLCAASGSVLASAFMRGRALQQLRRVLTTSFGLGSYRVGVLRQFPTRSSTLTPRRSLGFLGSFAVAVVWWARHLRVCSSRFVRTPSPLASTSLFQRLTKGPVGPY